eukprot:5928678-Amphidinium_carterae.1
MGRNLRTPPKCIARRLSAKCLSHARCPFRHAIPWLVGQAAQLGPDFARKEVQGDDCVAYQGSIYPQR